MKNLPILVYLHRDTFCPQIRMPMQVVAERLKRDAGMVMSVRIKSSANCFNPLLYFFVYWCNTIFVPCGFFFNINLLLSTPEFKKKMK